MTYGMRHVRPRNVRRSSRLLVLLTVFGATVFLIFYLSAHVFILSLKGSVIASRNERIKVENEIKDIAIEVTGLKMSSRIIKIASEDLGLIMPVGAPEKLF